MCDACELTAVCDVCQRGTADPRREMYIVPNVHDVHQIERLTICQECRDDLLRILLRLQSDGIDWMVAAIRDGIADGGCDPLRARRWWRRSTSGGCDHE